jgi:23S rRNA pseudouridine1911/1915/1917 synthase
VSSKDSLTVSVPPEMEGARLDVALAELLPQFSDAFKSASRSQIQKLIEAGGVLIASQPAKKNLVLAGGEVVEVVMSAWEELNIDRAAVIPPGSELADVRIVYEDDYLVALAKPAGLTTHPVAGMSEPTLVDYLKASSFRLAETDDALKPGIVHRLDKGTSGLLLVAKDTPTHAALQRTFERRQALKYYLALAIGGEMPETGVVDEPLERNPRHRELYTVGAKGRLALTYYRVIGAHPVVKLVLLRIVTGRTHQIRVHLQSRGQAIVGDDDYGRGMNVELTSFLEGARDKSYRSAWSEALPDAAARKQLLAAIGRCPGFFLHSYALYLKHPATGEQMELRAEPPEYFADALKALRLPPPPVDPRVLLPPEAKP